MAVEIEKSSNRTSKISFKAMGRLTRQLNDVQSVYQYTKKSSKTFSEQNLTNIKINNIQNNIQNIDKMLNFTVEKSIEITQDETDMTIYNDRKELPQMTTEDLMILSSFDCYSSFPVSIEDYINNTFISEFSSSYTDIHQKRPDKEMLPRLLNVQNRCYKNSTCETTLSLDKQYGSNTTHDKLLVADNIFHCCEYSNSNLSGKCKEAKPLVLKSTVQHSKKPILFVDLNADLFMTNLHKMYEVSEKENRLDMIQVPAPDILRLREKVF